MEYPDPPEASPKVVFLFATALSLAILVVWLDHAADWQNASRAVARLVHLPTAYPLAVAGTSLLCFSLVLALFRLFRYVLGQVRQAVDRIFPPRFG